MKKFLVISFLVCLMIVCPMMVACSGEQLPLSLTIANFDNYQSISVGVENTQSSRVLLSNGNNQKRKPHLVGKRKDGSFEKISFEEQKDGQKIVNNYGIVAIKNVGSFFILKYALGYTGEVSNEISSWGSGDILYALHKKSGKMFDISNNPVNVFTRGVYCVSGDDSFFALELLGDKKISKFSVVDGELEVKEVLDLSKFNAFSCQFVADKYGNMFSRNGYILTTQGELSVFDTDVKIAKNGIAYVGNKWVTAEGVLEDAEFVPNDMTNLNFADDYYGEEKYLVYQEANTSYYRSTQTSEQSGKIYKYTFTNEIEYTLEIINLQKYEDKTGVIIKDRIYFLDSTEIYYVNVNDGSFVSISSDYFFNKIYTDNQDNIIFEGIDNYLNDVVGIVSQNDIVSVGITPKQFEIFYISPIN